MFQTLGELRDAKRRPGFMEADWELIFDHMDFEMPLRYPCADGVQRGRSGLEIGMWGQRQTVTEMMSSG